jgi:cystathionine beta-lyase
MWVADMDFETAPEIQAAIMERAKQGIFGYTIIPDEWYQAYIDWWGKRHDFDIKKEWLVFSMGVVPSISSIVRKLTTPAEKVLLQTPVYNVFFNCVLNNGRQVIENPLKYDGVNYEIDFDDLEQKLADEQTTMMILCNPHNPIGRIWDRETLERIGELCDRYNVVVISDEIHCDLTDPGRDYVPYASVSEKCRDNSITCIAPTKTFNLAGIKSSAVVIPNKQLYHKVWRGLNTDEVAAPNAFSVDATVAAFTKGGEWLDELRAYIYENKKIAANFIEKEIPQIKLTPSEATYLLWLNYPNMKGRASEVSRFIRKKTGLFLSAGRRFGGNGGDFMRMNIACPKKVLYDGLERLKKGVEAEEE